jgi:hydroxyacylglutathione hydrolase
MTEYQIQYILKEVVSMLFVPIRTSKITDSIYAVSSLMVNLFIIRDGNDIICIDSGINTGIVKLGLNKLGINPMQITKVFLTHSDYDHAGGIKLFRNAELYLPADEEQMINGTTARKAKIKYNSPIRREYKLIRDQQEIHIGNLSIKGISSPGHTVGSMSYLVNGSYLFVGDSMALINGRAHTFPRFINMDTKAQKDTIRKLAKLKNIEFMFTAHSGYTRNFAEAVQRWS